ncbi:MAG: hypothetical protein IPI66_14410 [Chitinophagaceae bacterium]|nr:hypothetical protein [Chitinophagaceae bacterium]MBL0056863.1 hypothetical protein [Chitinophagaceae bacterium]
MNKNYLKQVLIPALVLFTLGTQAQGLKLKLVKGQKFEVTSIMKVSSSMSVMGQDMENNVDNNSVQKIEVMDTRGNETDLALSTVKLSVNTQMMGQEMSYDSDKKDNSGPLAEELDKTVNKVSNMTIDANGNVIRSDSSNEKISSMSMLAGGNSEALYLIKKAIVGHDLAPGLSWNDSTVSQEEKMTTKTVGIYTVKSVNAETRSATVLFNGTQSVIGTMEQMGMEMSLTTNNKLEGQYEVDLNTGLITQSSVITTGTSNIEASGMSIPGTTKVTNTVTVKML